MVDVIDVLEQHGIININNEGGLWSCDISGLSLSVSISRTTAFLECMNKHKQLLSRYQQDYISRSSIH